MTIFNIVTFVFDCIKGVFSDWELTGNFSGKDRFGIFFIIIRSTLCCILIESLIANCVIDSIADAVFNGCNLPSFIPIICGFVVQKNFNFFDECLNGF